MFMCALSAEAPKYIKPTLLGVKGEMGCNVTVLAGFPFSTREVETGDLYSSKLPWSTRWVSGQPVLATLRDGL